ncbi:hypothetical protein VPH35_058049 [Triticum aestivum]
MDMDPPPARGRRYERETVRRRLRQESLDRYWNPNQHEPDREAVRAGEYYAYNRIWDTEEISIVYPTHVLHLHAGQFNDARARDALQIFSIKVESIRGGLRWPLDVFGMVIARDVLDIDRKRNIIFAHPRSNPQTITEEHPYLELTGPARAVVTSGDPGKIENVLKVKGATESDDRDLSLLVLPLKNRMYCEYDRYYTSKHSTLELTFRHIDNSVEATIGARLIGGSSWPHGLQGVMVARISDMEDAEVSLLAFGGGKLHVVADDSMIKLTRRVVSVEHRDGELKVSIVARCENDEQVISVRDDIVFTPKKNGRTSGVLKVGTCKIQLTVAWSLFN